ncbi:MAG: hypothetical protein EAZ55_03985 [Cytophagales bacterium]|nr:MAG: hypothetical protein EAZ55_03985 [Cytophagales bacterium]
MILLGIHAFFLSILIAFLKKRYENTPLGSYWYYFVFLKIIAGLGVGLLYLHAYHRGGDTWLYYEQGSLLADVIYKSPLLYTQIVCFDTYSPDVMLPWEQPRALFFVKLVSLFNLLTQNNYWLMSIYFSLFSAWAMWYFANNWALLFPTHKMVIVASFLAIPSVIVWSSGLQKESLAWTFIGFWGAYSLRYASNKSNIYTLFGVSLVCSYGLWVLKFYYLIGILFFIFVFFVLLYGQKATLQIRILMFFVLLSALVVEVFWLRFHTGWIYAIIDNHNSSYHFSLPNTAIQYYKYTPYGFYALHPHYSSWLPNIPLALFSGLFRPLPYEAYGTLALLASLENTLLICYFVFWIFFAKKHVYHFPLQFSLLAYCLLLATVLALASPNYGSLVRYKIVWLPLAWYGLLSSSSIYFFKKSCKYRD